MRNDFNKPNKYIDRNFYLANNYHRLKGNVIANAEDVERFLKETNCLHDADLIGIDYRPHIRSNCNLTSFSSDGSYLILRYFVTSLSDLSVVELKFDKVWQWQIKWQINQGEALMCNITTGGKTITFSDSCGTEVAAQSMMWEIVDRPGLRLQRGGTKDAVWYTAPFLAYPNDPEAAGDLADILFEISQSVTNANIYYTRGVAMSPPDDNTAFKTDYVHSFLSEDTIFADENSSFCWYYLPTRDDLKNIIESHDVYYEQNYIFAICDDDGFAYTAEIVEWGIFNLVICSNRGDLQKTHFFNHKYHLNPYTGYGLEELA